ncbi:polymorphic toxin type 25 domain-containing protein [Cedecea neteri]|uniref:polymorphic toxin type 25 domain-containing protein n=1 Tax=Cedecea neteri TaxID=158822 RepID=UPI002892FA60|nr:polymorphic toxin type 25 domain-containing protein [Cedecea neteri]WNJ81577.1 polymorphic toxin type 25 domain-containing protein [Cedecea neteri]
MTHAVWGVLAAQLSGGNAAAGAAGAFSSELAARHIAAEMFPDTKPGDLNQDQKQLISLLGTMAAGIADGVVGNSTAAATTGAQAGKNAVENNGLSYESLIPLRVTQDASLALDIAPHGKSGEEIYSAIEDSHLGPAVGREYKPNAKFEASAGVGLAVKGGAEINNDYFSVTKGYTKEFGATAGATIGVDFGPYAPGLFGNLERDYAISGGFGVGSAGLSVGKDGISVSLGGGPSIRLKTSTTSHQSEKIEMNGDTTKEIYHYDFK